MIDKSGIKFVIVGQNILVEPRAAVEPGATASGTSPLPVLYWSGILCWEGVGVTTLGNVTEGGTSTGLSRSRLYRYRAIKSKKCKQALRSIGALSAKKKVGFNEKRLKRRKVQIYMFIPKLVLPPSDFMWLYLSWRGV